MIFSHLLLKVFNKILTYNESSILLLKLKAGKSFKLNLPGLSFSGLIDVDGLLTEPLTKEYNVEITLPLMTASYLINQDKLATFKQISFVGDVALGREILEILSNLRFSGIYATLSPNILFLITPLNKIILSVKNSLLLLQHNATHSISEYLLYETEDLVTQYEIEEFCNAVDDLNNRVNLLNAHINLLSEPTL